MKYLIIITLALTSCTKDWSCCVESQAHNTGLPFLDNNITTHCMDYRGTNQEIQQFEADGTKTTDLYPGYLEQTTTCVKD